MKKCFMLAWILMLMFQIEGGAQTSIPSPISISEVSAMITLSPGLSIESAFRFPADKQLLVDGETIVNPLLNLPAYQQYVLASRSAFIREANLAVSGSDEIIIVVYDYYKGCKTIVRYSRIGATWRGAFVGIFGFVDERLILFYQYSDSQDFTQRLVIVVRGNWERYITINADKTADLNLDGAVNGLDLLLMQAQWKVSE